MKTKVYNQKVPYSRMRRSENAHIIDNRVSFIAQTKMINLIQRANTGYQSIEKKDASAPVPFSDNRPEMLMQRKWMDTVNQYPLQCRKMLGAELNVTEDGTVPIFDSRVHNGILFSKNVTVPDLTANTIAKSYHLAICPIGNIMKAHTYTDYGLVNFVPAMPVVAPANIITYLTTQIVQGHTVQDHLHVTDPSAMRILVERLNWQGIKERLSQWYWNRDTLLNNRNIGLIDPFVVRMTLKSSIRNKQGWEVDTQFADSGAGYITRVHDGKNDITGSIVTARDFNLDQNTPAVDKSSYIYSSTHAAVGDFGVATDAMSPYNAGDNMGSKHAGFDAFTWMAAEGARFKPVGDLGERATPTANFYTKPYKTKWKDAHNVTLDWLMQSWGTHFGRAYGITAATMIPVVDGNGDEITHKPAKPNYNLTKETMEK